MSDRTKQAAADGIKFAREAPRALSVIAAEIRRDWKKVYFGAAPYLQAMLALTALSDDYGHDSAVSIVHYFLSNANTWRGPVAAHIKAELREMLKLHKAGTLKPLQGVPEPMRMGVVDHGTVWQFIPLNDAAKNWLAALGTEDWQWMGKTLNVDHRPARALLEAFQAEGGKVV